MNEQQQKYQQFMKMDPVELVKNLEEFIKPYISEELFFENMNCYVEALSLPGQEQYNEKRNYVHEAYCEQAIYQYLKEGNKDDFSAFRHLNRMNVQFTLEKCLKKFPEYETEIQYAQNHIFELPEGCFSIELESIYDTSDKKYINVLVPLLLCTKEEAVSSLRKSRFLEKTFHNYLRFFQARFPNYPQAIEYLKSLYEEYLNIALPSQKECYYVRKFSFEDDFQKIYDSKMSIEGYCFYYGKSVSEINTLVKSHRCSKKAIEILSRDNTVFFEKVKEIIGQIILNDIDYLEYYQMTKLKLSSLLTIVKSLGLEKEKCRKVIDFIDKGKRIEKTKIIESIQLEKLIKFGDREITREEKIKIFSFLKENGIPLCYYNFALTKYVKGELNFGKQLEKKQNKRVKKIN